MTTEIMFLGGSGYRITNGDGRVALIDPHLEGNPYSPIGVRDLSEVDLICVTHGAADHLGDAAQIAKEFDCPVCCGSDVRELLIAEGVDATKVRGMCWGLMLEEAGMRVRSVTSMHWSYVHLPDGTYVTGQPMGFILYAERGVRIYHWGDTAIFSDLRLIGDLYRPRVGIVGCSVPIDEQWERHGVPCPLNGEMTPQEAALAARWLGVEYAVASHYSQAAGNRDTELFGQILDGFRAGDAVSPAPVILEPGDMLLYPQEGDRTAR